MTLPETSQALIERAQAADAAVQQASERCLAGCLPAFCLVAVGGYGRRELFPGSDIDLLVLLAAESASGAIKEPLGAFLRLLWDAGFRASQSVRTLADCLRIHEGNLQLTISLLDHRFLCGDQKLYACFEERFPPFLKTNSSRLLQSLAALVHSRHAKFEDTVHHLEPDIKEGPGGIRDLHFLAWSVQLAPWKEPLLEAGRAAGEARPFLYALRYFLHSLAGRDSNLLTFELQDAASEHFGQGQTQPEEWMRLYYRHARAVFQAASRALDFIGLEDATLIRQFFDRRGRKSTGDFTVAQNRIYLRNPAITLASAPSVFQVFAYVARHGIPLAADTRRRLRERAAALDPHSAPELLTWAAWRELFQGHHAALAIREMLESDLLAVFVPPWRAIECLVVRDYYHRYTVDEHTVVALDAIDRLFGSSENSTARFRELALEEGDLTTLRFALLLHDVGKGVTPGDHVAGSLQTARRLMELYTVPPEDQLQVEFLIEKHLLLASAMNGLDPDDPATARHLTSQIPTLEDLRRLTLLTCADISAVNPTAMSHWRAEQLWHIYSVTSAQFARELDARRIHNQAADSPPIASGLPPSPALAQFLEGFPTRYLRTHTARQIEAHHELDKQRRRAGVGVSLELNGGIYALTVVALDRPGLFARLCGALASFGMNIRKAEASSNAAGCALDEFRFEDPAHTLELNPEESERLKRTVDSVARGVLEVADLLKRRRPLPRPRNAPRLIPFIRFDNDASEHATLIHFAGEDRPGLLFDLASVLTDERCDIALVLVNTEAHRALDVFYVNREGRKLTGQDEDQLRHRLAAAAGSARI